MRNAIALAALACTLAHAPRAGALVWPDVPDRIERALASSDPVARRVAARELMTLGPGRGGPLVLKALGDPDPEVQIAAAQSAIRLRIAGATDAVLPWLGAPQPALRVAACEVARALPDPRAVPQLARALGDNDAQVRAAAADALGAYAGSADAVVPLLGRLDDPSPSVRVVIARALARLGDTRAVVPLVGKVQDSVPEVRQAVARALGELGDARAAQALVLQLRDNSAEVRVEALGALGRLRPPDAVDAVAPLALDRAPPIRQAALAALGQIATPAAVSALVATLGLGDDAGGSLERTPVRDALVVAGSAPANRDDARAAGSPVDAELAAVLARPTSPAAATSAAWVLGALHAQSQARAIVSAMRKGALPSAAALHALASAGTSAEVPVVLEFIADPNPLVREEARGATGALLDPARPDGRAVEPLTAALKDPRLTAAERASVARLLGRTGAARAAAVLTSLATAKDGAVRLAAIDALGTLGPAPKGATADLAPLLDALGDPDAAIRLHASMALADAGDDRTRDALLAKLDAQDEVDRIAVLGALGGVLARAPSDAAIARLARELDLAAGAERDAVLQAIGRAPLPSARDVLVRVAQEADVDDRRKVASLLAAHAGDPRAASLARALLDDPDGAVRAQASWALGTIGDASAIAPLDALAAGADENVAIDAVAAVGRIVARERTPSSAASPLCARLGDARPYVRANALAALALASARCGDGARERTLLTDDPVDGVRAAAALTLIRTAAAGVGGDADRRALARCSAADRSGAVAQRCRVPPPAPARTHAVEVYVVPDVATTPKPRAPYALELADGLVRAGIADRRGAVFDPVAPEGLLTLHRPVL